VKFRYLALSALLLAGCASEPSKLFPHDSYWPQVTLRFSDDSEEVVQLEKSGEPQYFQFKKRTVTQVTALNLQKAADESPFPALDEVEFYGVNAE